MSYRLGIFITVSVRLNVGRSTAYIEFSEVNV